MSEQGDGIMIDLTIHEAQLERAVRRARERKILIPTFREQISPERVPDKVKEKLKGIGLWDINPLNLFNIDKYGCCADIIDSKGSGDISVCLGNDLIARACPHRCQCQV